MKLNILGTEYELEVKARRDDPQLETNDGYCDRSAKRIVVCDMTDGISGCGDVDAMIRETKRHEITHAFMSESGLVEDWQHQEFGQEETIVSWIAVQFPKMVRVFRKADCM